MVRDREQHVQRIAHHVHGACGDGHLLQGDVVVSAEQHAPFEDEKKQQVEDQYRLLEMKEVSEKLA